MAGCVRRAAWHLAVLVASPGLLDPVANSVADMRLANLFCWAGSLPAGTDLDFLGKEPPACESHRPDVKAIRARRMQQDQLRVAHTIPPSRNGRLASSR